MANRRTHRTVGAVAGAFLAFVLSKGQPVWHRIVELIGGTTAGLFSALLPDIFEPADSPNHRSLIHGVLPNTVLLVYCARRLRLCQVSLRSRADDHANLAKQAQTAGSRLWHWSVEFFCRFFAGAAAGALIGYGSHLALDAFTPRSLPPIA
jgi:hypothetical protein